MVQTRIAPSRPRRQCSGDAVEDRVRMVTGLAVPVAVSAIGTESWPKQAAEDAATLVRHAELYGTEKMSMAACCASTLMSSPSLNVGLANSIPTGAASHPLLSRQISRHAPRRFLV